MGVVSIVHSLVTPGSVPFLLSPRVPELQHVAFLSLEEAFRALMEIQLPDVCHAISMTLYQTTVQHCLWRVPFRKLLKTKKPFIK